ncbi:MAG: hypothetical protein IJQ46_02470 [Oscillospiraceae bacterium]|nr:hypothetical protein [Oscillospiraceae bacterium]MBR0211232.1 hypothetical protein [Oscillospiraceae bacterium]
MASKKKKAAARDDIKATAEYYKLHTNAVDDLVNADESNSPVVSEEELRQYLSGPKLRLADWAKAILVKMWFAGSVCFFVFWGLSAYIGARLDLMVVFGIVLGVVTDVLTNSILRYFAKTPTANDRWMMFPQKKYYTFPLNIVYAIVLLLCVDVFYTLLNMALMALFKTSMPPIGVEPILFGIFYTGFDLLFITMKRLFRQMVADAKISAKGTKS